MPRNGSRACRPSLRVRPIRRSVLDLIGVRSTPPDRNGDRGNPIATMPKARAAAAMDTPAHSRKAGVAPIYFDDMLGSAFTE